MNLRKFWACCWVCGIALLLESAPAAEPTAATPTASAQRETTAKPLSERERRKREERLRRELASPYKKWLNEDVLYIITDEERQAFRRFSTDEEREQFVEQFWLRRDPTPDTAENEFREEHYRRIAYANDHFASGIPGWKTDRGRIYIMFGPADEVEAHPSGGSYERPIEEGGGQTSTYPFEVWRYRYLEGIGTDVLIEFVDPTLTGEYHMTMDPSEKDALMLMPNAGLTLYEQMGLTSKNDRFSRSDGTRLGTGNTPLPSRLDQFQRLEQWANLSRPPQIKFRDLEAIVNTRITYNLLPIKVRIDFIRMTESTVSTNVTVQLDNRDLQFQNKEGVSRATVNMYARITSMSRRVVNVWEEPVVIEAPTEMLAAQSGRSSVYSHSVYLAPGTYRLNVVVKDVVAGTMNNYEVALRVPRFPDDALSISSIMLADLIERVPTRSIGTGQFVIGDSKVRPRVTEAFRRDERMGIYFQLYNFQPDQRTQRPNGEIQYEILRNGSDQAVLNFREDVNEMPGASARQVTVEKLLPLARLEPGEYTLRMKVTDRNRNQVLTPSAAFRVN
ncbi:MAG: GWxTD domain-containing protein [Bryobacteraceae bacterium]